MEQPTQPPLDSFLARAEGLLQRLEAILPSPHQPQVIAPDWSASVAFRYRKRSSAAWGVGWLEPVRHVAHIAYADLKEVDTQKERFGRNVAQFVAGRTANNVLLSGARGTGKSSLVKAALHAHADAGLRLIAVPAPGHPVPPADLALTSLTDPELGAWIATW